MINDIHIVHVLGLFLDSYSNCGRNIETLIGSFLLVLPKVNCN